MAWKIIFNYQDGGQLKVSNNQRKLSRQMAESYQKQYAKPSNDGGMVYISPYKTCTPIPLADYIAQNGGWCVCGIRYQKNYRPRDWW